MDEPVDDSAAFSKGRGILVQTRAISNMIIYVISWSSSRGKIEVPAGYEFLAWAYFPKGPN